MLKTDFRIAKGTFICLLNIVSSTNYNLFSNYHSKPLIQILKTDASRLEMLEIHVGHALHVANVSLIPGIPYRLQSLPGVTYEHSVRSKPLALLGVPCPH